MVTACLPSPCRAATPAMVAAMPAWLTASGMAAVPVPAWQPGGGGGVGVACRAEGQVARERQHQRGAEHGDGPQPAGRGRHTTRPYR